MVRFAIILWWFHQGFKIFQGSTKRLGFSHPVVHGCLYGQVVIFLKFLPVKMRIGIYAGSIHSGGGLTVLAQIISALAKDEAMHLVVYTGVADTTQAVKQLALHHGNVEVRPFMPGSPSPVRYLAAKALFLWNRSSRDFDWLVSFNYHLPANCPVLVYHVNLLSFMPASPDNFAMRLKRMDARWACYRASSNVFESRYLLERARKVMGSKINEPSVLYVGVHPTFFRDSVPSLRNADVLLVTSNQPHKDNGTCLRALALLVQRRPEIPWRLVVAGGQGIAQWDELRESALRLGVAGHVEILGPVTREALSQRMNTSLCLVSASRIESFCMTAVESMASRCPAIVTDATAMPESVGDAAIIVEPGNAEQFAAACERLHDDPVLRARYVDAGVAWARGFAPEIFRDRLRALLFRRHGEAIQ